MYQNLFKNKLKNQVIQINHKNEVWIIKKYKINWFYLKLKILTSKKNLNYH